MQRVAQVCQRQLILVTWNHGLRVAPAAIVRSILVQAQLWLGTTVTTVGLGCLIDISSGGGGGGAEPLFYIYSA